LFESLKSWSGLKSVTAQDQLACARFACRLPMAVMIYVAKGAR